MHFPIQTPLHPRSLLAEDLARLTPLESVSRLMGWRLRSADGMACELVELEAYWGADDLGSHASRGPTPRNLSMFGPPGRAYVYLSYGVHWLLNIVVRPPGEGGAVLVRAGRPLAGIEEMRMRRPKSGSERDLLAGPGRLSTAFALTRSHDGLDLLDPQGPLWLEPPLEQDVGPIDWGTRIGLAPGKGDLLPWRGVLRSGRSFASRPLPRVVD